MVGNLKVEIPFEQITDVKSVNYSQSPKKKPVKIGEHILGDIFVTDVCVDTKYDDIWSVCESNPIKVMTYNTLALNFHLYDNQRLDLSNLLNELYHPKTKKIYVKGKLVGEYEEKDLEIK